MPRGGQAGRQAGAAAEEARQKAEEDARLQAEAAAETAEGGDGDGFGDASVTVLSCSQPTGFVNDNSDCDDNESLSNPSATEVCDGIDNDCDGVSEMTDDGTVDTNEPAEEPSGEPSEEDTDVTEEEVPEDDAEKSGCATATPGSMSWILLTPLALLGNRRRRK